ncbi:hypothetical protein [Gimesia sp.]|uniref:hypothetical protein n=1 Tax=Gimesia sp. TaxID=2024833 RepID=UPI003A95324E
MRVFLQVVAVLMFAGGVLGFNSSPVAGTVICLMAIALLTVTLRHSRSGIRKLLEVTRKATARTSNWALCYLFLVLLAVPAWIWCDASFQSAYTWARVDLGIPDETGRDFLFLNFLGASYLEDAGKPTLYWEMHSLSVLGPRIGVMLLVLCGSVICILLAVIHILLNGASKKYIVLFTLCVSGIGTLVYQQDNLLWYAVRYRVSKNLPRFEKALKPLLEKWPTKSGTLPEIGKFFANEGLPGQVFLHDTTRYESEETMGSFISKLPDEGISFTLEPHYLFRLEYHPPESGPLKKVRGRFWTEHLTRSDRIAEGWYLTQYSATRNEEEDQKD